MFSLLTNRFLSLKKSKPNIKDGKYASTFLVFWYPQAVVHMFPSTCDINDWWLWWRLKLQNTRLRNNLYIESDLTVKSTQDINQLCMYLVFSFLLLYFVGTGWIQNCYFINHRKGGGRNMFCIMTAKIYSLK